MNKSLIITILALFSLSGCSGNFFKRADVKDVPVNINDRIKKNVEEGRGIRFGNKKKGGTFDFASSNELWRASMDVLDFVPFSNASYSGGILITDWFAGNSKTKDKKRDLKITVRFLDNKIRADALNISIYEKVCQTNGVNCSTKKIISKLEPEIKLAILKRAAYLENNQFKKNAKEYRSKKRTTVNNN
tara:strand:- start:613 stop:1179 length:567 start_codon:yes stop_codon:yes gene_type:complete